MINNFLIEKNSFIFESVRKRKNKRQIYYIGRNPDFIWEFQGGKCKQIINNKLNFKNSPKKVIDQIIENFKFDIPKELPNISSIISGYFSYDYNSLC